MYSVEISSIRLSFEPAIIQAPQSGSNFDWLNDKWVKEPQRIDVIQRTDSALIKGLSGYGTQLGENNVHLIKPELTDLDSVKTHLHKVAEERGDDSRNIAKAIECINYSWGILVSLLWHELGYAPGGSESVVLPANSKAIYFGLVPINWDSLIIENV